MNCPECQDVLQRRLDGTVLVPDAALDQHLAQCPPCRERHAAARRLLEGLRASPRRVPPADFARRVVAAALRDRQRRRSRLRRSLYLTAGLAAAILLMLLAGYVNHPNPGDGKPDVGPVAKQDTPPELKKDAAAPPTTLAAVTGRLADKTLEQAKVLLTAANPVEGLPVGELANVAEPLEPAAEPLRQARQEAGEGLQAVARSARRAFDYFARDLPMPEAPQGN
jgi:hypothetical protein